LEFEAESLINWYTFNRLKNEDSYPEEVKRLMYYIINLLVSTRNAMNINSSGSASSPQELNNIKSQSNDGVSVSYQTLSANDLIDKNKQAIEEAVDRYLQGVVNSLGQKLLYRGLYKGE
jgi:hypothetical protein